MVRTQISMTEEQMGRLRRAAGARGVSIAAIIREAVDRSVPDETADRRALQQRAFARAGSFGSGYNDTAERHDESLAEKSRW